MYLKCDCGKHQKVIYKLYIWNCFAIIRLVLNYFIKLFGCFINFYCVSILIFRRVSISLILASVAVTWPPRSGVGDRRKSCCWMCRRPLLRGAQLLTRARQQLRLRGAPKRAAIENAPRNKGRLHLHV